MPTRIESENVSRRFPTVALVVAAIFLAKFVAYAWLVTPLWDIPDESGHFSYIQDIADGKWPVLGEARMDEDVTRSWRGPEATPGLNWIAQHPPLFYALGVPLVAAGRTADLGFESQVRLARMPAALFGALTILGIALFLARATRREELGLAGAVFFAATPMFTHLSTGVSHDTLVACTVAWAAYWCVRGLEGGDFRHFLYCAALVAAATLTKITALALAVPLFATLVWWLWRRRGTADSWRLWAFRSTTLWLVMFGPICLWIARNLLLFDQAFPDASIIYGRQLASIGFLEFMQRFPLWQSTLLNFIALIGWNGSPSGELIWIQADGWMARYFLGMLGASSLGVMLQPLLYRVENPQRWACLTFVGVVLAYASAHSPLVQLALATCVLVGAAVSCTLAANAKCFIVPDRHGWLLATAAACTLFFVFVYYHHLWASFTGSLRATHGRYLYPVVPFLLLILVWPFRARIARRMLLSGALGAMVFADGFYLHRVFNLYGQL